MLLQEPPRTQYDLNFAVFGIPVRVHPMFWLISLLFGINGGDKPSELAIWVGVVFVSVLVHELGHALTARSLGARPWITLYGMGGLASYHGARNDTRSSVLITAAGPAAGFLLAAGVILAVLLSGRSVYFMGFEIGQGAWIDDRQLHELIRDLLFVNIFWGVINLLPIQPLDGGQIVRTLMVAHDPWNGMQRSLWLSVMAGGLAAIAGVLLLHSMFMGLFFGYLAYTSYLMLQGHGNSW